MCCLCIVCAAAVFAGWTGWLDGGGRHGQHSEQACHGGHAHSHHLQLVHVVSVEPHCHPTPVHAAATACTTQRTAQRTAHCTASSILALPGWSSRSVSSSASFFQCDVRRSISTLIPGIPVLAIMVRYNLLNAGDVGPRMASFLGVVAPCERQRNEAASAMAGSSVQSSSCTVRGRAFGAFSDYSCTGQVACVVSHTRNVAATHATMPPCPVCRVGDDVLLPRLDAGEPMQLVGAAHHRCRQPRRAAGHLPLCTPAIPRRHR